jgi:phytoene desaturase
MEQKTKAVIIGSGVGGIATAVFLARKGYDVEIFEKNPNPGGRCGQMIREGHRFDLGATILLMPSLYRDVFSALGLDMDEELEAQKLDPLYKLFFSDGSDFSYFRSDSRMKKQLESFEKGSSGAYDRYVKEGYDFFKLAVSGLLNRNFYHLFQFINLKNVMMLIRLKTWINHMDYVKRFFKDSRLHKAFTFQNIYVGQNVYRQPAFFSMLPGAEIAEGAYFPKGGMHRIVEKLLEEADKYNVKIRFNEPVEQIIITKDKARGIRLESGREVLADIVVANADLPYVYNHLLPRSRKAASLRKKEYSCSALVFHWAMDKIYPQLEQHSIFLNDPYKEGMEKIFRDKTFSDHPSFYVHSPARTDAQAAPDGQDSISVIIPVGHIDPQNPQDWQELRSKARASVITRLKEAGLEDIEEHIKFEICFTPRTFEKYCNVTNGSVFGSLSHVIFQMGYFRPHNRHSKYRNLYFTGGSTHPGNGVPLVLLSSKLTSERIFKDAGK